MRCKSSLYMFTIIICFISPRLTRYPYDTHQSPAYELTYVHQVVALYVAANLNVGKDSLVTSLLAQCRCRLRLLALALTTLSQDINVVGNVSYKKDM